MELPLAVLFALSTLLVVQWLKCRAVKAELARLSAHAAAAHAENARLAGQVGALLAELAELQTRAMVRTSVPDEGP